MWRSEDNFPSTLRQGLCVVHHCGHKAGWPMSSQGFPCLHLSSHCRVLRLQSHTVSCLAFHGFCTFYLRSSCSPCSLHHPANAYPCFNLTLPPESSIKAKGTSVWKIIRKIQVDVLEGAMRGVAPAFCPFPQKYQEVTPWGLQERHCLDPLLAWNILS